MLHYLQKRLENIRLKHVTTEISHEDFYLNVIGELSHSICFCVFIKWSSTLFFCRSHNDKCLYSFAHCGIGNNIELVRYSDGTKESITKHNRL